MKDRPHSLSLSLNRDSSHIKFKNTDVGFDRRAGGLRLSMLIIVEVDCPVFQQL